METIDSQVLVRSKDLLWHEDQVGRRVEHRKDHHGAAMNAEAGDDPNGCRCRHECVCREQQRALITARNPKLE